MSTQEAAAKAPPKKKDRVIKKPVPPSSVSTALIILRGAISGVLGCPIGTGGVGENTAVGSDAVSFSLMQPAYIKDKYPSGKFSVSLGKKNGTACELFIPDSGDNASGAAYTQNELLDAIEQAANRIVAQNLDIVTFTMDRDEAIAKYGTCMLDQSQMKLPKKAKPEDKILTLAYIENTILAVPPGPVLSKTGDIPDKIVLQREGSNNVCSVTAGKKARKCDIVFKFRIGNDGEEIKATSASDAVAKTADGSVDASLIAPMLTTSIHMPEGEALHSKQLELEAVQAAEAVKIEETPAVADTTAGGAKPEGDMVVNAFEVKGKIDYNKLVDNFGSKLIDEELMQRMERLTVGRGTVPFLHRFLRRNIFFSHRDMNKICDCLEQNKPFYLYTGRGPSSGAMHLGHLVPFLFTQWLQQAFQCPLVIQMTDDEKFLFKGSYDENEGDNLDYFANLTMQNAKDIIACGFIPEKTFIFSDLNYVGQMYPNIVRIWKAVTNNTVNGIFGFDGTSNIGKTAFPAIQAAPSFPSSFPVALQAGRTAGSPNCDMACLIPCAIDQDPYFRMTRDIAHKLVPKSHPLGGKPALIHSKFFPPLQGAEGKMSSSDDNSAVFLTDSADSIERKIKENAFSGGQESKKLQEELGADLNIDVSYQWLRFFMEDDEELELIGKDYSTGSGKYWSTGLVKARLVEVLREIVDEHQRKRALVTDEVVLEWMAERSLH